MIEEVEHGYFFDDLGSFELVEAELFDGFID